MSGFELTALNRWPMLRAIARDDVRGLKGDTSVCCGEGWWANGSSGRGCGSNSDSVSIGVGVGCLLRGVLSLLLLSHSGGSAKRV